MPQYDENGNIISYGGVGYIPTTSASAMTTGGGNIATTGTNTVGGSYFYDSALQMAQYLGNLELQKLLEQGVNERFAKQMADNEAERSLQRSIATGYIDGNPTLDRQVQEWNRQNQLWNQGYQEQQLGLDYAQTLASLTGPQDWLKYSNMLRNTANTELPGYLQALQSGSTLAGFQNTAGTTNGQNSWAQSGQLPGYENAQNATYTPPWLRDYGGFQAGGYNGWNGTGSSSGTLDYATALQQARQQLVALGGNQWATASEAQIIAELNNNPTLFVNSPIRTALLGGGTSDAPIYANGQVGVTGWPVGNGNGDYLFQGGPYVSGSEGDYLVQGGPYVGGGDYNMQITPAWLNGGSAGQYPTSGTPTQQTTSYTSTGNPYASNNYGSLNLSATQIRPDQWNNMTDSEKAMLQGQVENTGGYWNDFLQMMQKGWNTGNARGTSTYGF